MGTGSSKLNIPKFWVFFLYTSVFHPKDALIPFSRDSGVLIFFQNYFNEDGQVSVLRKTWIKHQQLMGAAGRSGNPQGFWTSGLSSTSISQTPVFSY